MTLNSHSIQSTDSAELVRDIAQLHPNSAERIFPLEEQLDNFEGEDVSDASKAIELVKAQWNYEDALIELYREVIGACLHNAVCSQDEEIPWAKGCLDTLITMPIDDAFKALLSRPPTNTVVQRGD